MKKFKGIFCLFFVLWVFIGTPLNLYADDGLAEKGIAEFKAENYEEAAELLEKAYKENPKDPRVTYNLGLTYKEMQNYTGAAKFFKETISLDPGASEAKFYLADVLYNMASYEEALSAVDNAIKDGIKPAQSYYLKGLILIKLKRNSDAIGAFNKAKETDPSMKQQADFQMGTIYMQENQFKKASETFKGLITSDPTSDWATYSKDYLAALDKVQPLYRLNVGLGYQYDDNVLAVPIDQSLVDIAKKADWKRIYSLLGEYSLYAKGPFNVRASYVLNIVQYNKSDYSKTNGEKIASQDTVSNTLALMPSYSTDKGVTSLLFSYNHLEVDYARYLQTYTVNPSHLFVVSGNHLAQIYMRYKKVEHDAEFLNRKFSRYGSAAEDRDADNISLGAAYYYTFLQGNGLFNLRLERESNDADGGNWDYDGSKVSAGILYPLMDNKLKLNLFLERYYQKFWYVHTVYGKTRRDDTVTFQSSLTYTVIKPFDVSVGYTHIKDDSNISVYEYKKNLYTVNLEYRF